MNHSYRQQLVSSNINKWNILVKQRNCYELSTKADELGPIKRQEIVNNVDGDSYNNNKDTLGPKQKT